MPKIAKRHYRHKIDWPRSAHVTESASLIGLLQRSDDSANSVVRSCELSTRNHVHGSWFFVDFLAESFPLPSQLFGDTKFVRVVDKVMGPEEPK